MTSSVETLSAAYFIILDDGGTITRNRATICSIPGVIRRYQVYSDKGGKYTDKFFDDNELDLAINEFLRVSR